MKAPAKINRRALFAVSGALAAGGAAPQVQAQTPPRPAPDPTQPPVGPALARFIAGSADAELPADVAELGKLHILDTLASIVACRDLKPAVLGRKFAAFHTGGATRNAATILGTRDKAALLDAVFASAMTAHAAEINDFIPSAYVQPGPAIVSAVLGLGETRACTGAAMLRAVVTGYELAGRIPRAMGLANLRVAGIANHGIGPTFGAAAAAASVMRLPRDRIGDLLTFCSQQAAGSWQWQLDIEHVEKALAFAGMGARTGLQAALFAELGFTGVRDNLDRAGGWMSSPLVTRPGSDLDRASLIRDLGVRFEMASVGFKRYPTGGPAQPGVHGLLTLLPEVPAERTAKVTIAMPSNFATFRDAEMPALNLRYLAAIILLDHKLDFVAAQSLERMHSDPAVRSLMDRVEVVHDPAQDTPDGRERVESARVTITERNGAVHTTFVPFVPGYPSHPMTRAQVEAKAMGLMTSPLGAKRAAEVVSVVSTIESLNKASTLARLIAR